MIKAKIEKVSISSIKENENNPRSINKQKFEKLVKSVKEFPQMLSLRPIVVNKDNIILGGNMRYKACREVGLKEVYIIQAEDLTDKQAEEFIIKDNIGFGEWDWDILANTFDNVELKEWGLDVWQPEEEIDYSVLDEIDLEEKIDNLYDQTKKSVILEYPTEQYEKDIRPHIDKLKTIGVDLSELFLNALKNYES
jgi:ParB-like chromosome segregation protein Spo0J